jgi:predicted anti-sigma-YlaC factor YlaD
VICPIEHDTLVDYWAGELDSAEADAVDEHLLGCARCTEASARVAAIAQGLATVVPPFVVASDLAAARARGTEFVLNAFRPGEDGAATFSPGAELLVHRLVTDLSDTARVSVELRTSTGEPLGEFSDVPFDRSGDGLLVACRRHFMDMFPLDIAFVVRRIAETGEETVERYCIQHHLD